MGGRRSTLRTPTEHLHSRFRTTCSPGRTPSQRPDKRCRMRLARLGAPPRSRTRRRPFHHPHRFPRHRGRRLRQCFAGRRGTKRPRVGRAGYHSHPCYSRGANTSRSPSEADEAANVPVSTRIHLHGRMDRSRSRFHFLCRSLALPPRPAALTVTDARPNRISLS